MDFNNNIKNSLNLRIL